MKIDTSNIGSIYKAMKQRMSERAAMIVNNESVKKAALKETSDEPVITMEFGSKENFDKAFKFLQSTTISYIEDKSKLKIELYNMELNSAKSVIADIKRNTKAKIKKMVIESSEPFYSRDELEHMMSSYERHPAVGTNNDEVEAHVDYDDDEEYDGVSDDDDEYYDDDDYYYEEITEEELVESLEKELKRAAKSNKSIDIELDDGSEIEVDANTAKMILKNSRSTDLVRASENTKSFMRFLDTIDLDESVEINESVDWNKAPKWATFHATDWNGSNWWFEKKPEADTKKGTWSENSGKSKEASVDKNVKDVKDWQTKISTRPSGD